MKIKQCIICSIIIIILNACATYNPYYKDDSKTSLFPEGKEISHSFYLIGDAGKATINDKKKRLQFFENNLANAAEKSTTLFLGDNIYPKGFSNEDSEEKTLAIEHLDAQIKTVKNYKGRTIFIPGNHD